MIDENESRPGGVLYEARYSNDQLKCRETTDGLYEEWFQNGRISKRETYVASQQSWLTQTWTEAGALISEYMIEDWTGQTGPTPPSRRKKEYTSHPINMHVTLTYHSNGHVATKTVCNSARVRDGLYEEWFENGQLRYSCFYQPYQTSLDETTSKHGLVKTWWENGQLKSTQMFNHGKRSGLTLHYFENGQLESSMHYLDDKQDGLVECWYESGRLRSSGIYKAGKEVQYNHYMDADPEEPEPLMESEFN